MKSLITFGLRIVVALLLIITLLTVIKNQADLNVIYIFVYIALMVLSLLSDKFFYKGEKTENDGEEHNTTSHFLALAWFLTLVLPVMEYSITQRDELIISIFGIVMVLSGTMIRGISIRTLGNFFSRDVEAWHHQRIIKTGIYKYIRHPAYTGNIVQILGFPLVLNSYYSLMMSLITILIFLWRIRVEEAFLSERFHEYREYMNQTKKIIPKIW